MTLDEFIRNFEEATEGLESGTVGSGTRFQDLQQWDSLALLTTIAMIDAEYEISLSANEITGQQTLQELFELIRQRKS